MSKRTLGNILTIIGSPAMLGIVETFGVFSSNSGKAINLLWTIPLTIITLPLLPIYIEGEKILAECDKIDFEKRTEHLPRVANVLDQEFAYIEEFESKFYVAPYYYTEGEEAFKSLGDAVLFLKNLGYYEVVDMDSVSMETYWIR